MNEALMRAAIVQEAETWLGTPYHHGAAIKGVGVDCAQLPIRVYSAVGLIPRIETGYYPQQWHLHRHDERYLGFVRQRAVEVETPEPGDLVVYRYGRAFAHGAILADRYTLIHAFIGRGCERIERIDGELRNRPWKAFTLFHDERP